MQPQRDYGQTNGWERGPSSSNCANPARTLRTLRTPQSEPSEPRPWAVLAEPRPWAVLQNPARGPVFQNPARVGQRPRLETPPVGRFPREQRTQRTPPVGRLPRTPPVGGADPAGADPARGPFSERAEEPGRTREEPRPWAVFENPAAQTPPGADPARGPFSRDPARGPFSERTENPENPARGPFSRTPPVGATPGEPRPCSRTPPVGRFQRCGNPRELRAWAVLGAGEPRSRSAADGSQWRAFDLGRPVDDVSWFALTSVGADRRRALSAQFFRCRRTITTSASVRRPRRVLPSSGPSYEGAGESRQRTL